MIVLPLPELCPGKQIPAGGNVVRLSARQETECVVPPRAISARSSGRGGTGAASRGEMWVDDEASSGGSETEMQLNSSDDDDDLTQRPDRAETRPGGGGVGGGGGQMVRVAEGTCTQMMAQSGCQSSKHLGSVQARPRSGDLNVWFPR